MRERPASSRPRGATLRLYQSEVCNGLVHAIAANPGATLTVMFPRQAGKNEVSAALVGCLLMTHAVEGGSIILCAPTLTPQALISFERTRRYITAAYGHGVGPISIEGNTMRVANAIAIFLSASPTAHVAGHTASIALIADEAQDIDSDWFNRQFRPMAASTGAPTVLFGTPWDGHTLLERAVAANRAHDIRRDPEHDDEFHRQVPWEEVAKTRERYGAYVRAERARLGANHPLYLTQYELTAAEGAGGLLAPLQLAALAGLHPRLRAPLAGERYVGGLDLAGPGEFGDRSVLTIARVTGEGCDVVEHLAWRGAAFASVVRHVVAAAREWRIERLCADATGMGAPLVAQITDQLGARVEPFVFGATSKSDLGYALIAAAETGRLRLYANDGSSEYRICHDELRLCRANLHMRQTIQWQAPAGAHDDFVASLALCLRAATALPPPRVALGRRR
jgi:hypothetical protein